MGKVRPKLLTKLRSIQFQIILWERKFLAAADTNLAGTDGIQ
jgi:hypothetical protein